LFGLGLVALVVLFHIFPVCIFGSYSFLSAVLLFYVASSTGLCLSGNREINMMMMMMMMKGRKRRVKIFQSISVNRPYTCIVLPRRTKLGVVTRVVEPRMSSTPPF